MKIKDRWAGFIFVLLLALINTVKRGNPFLNVVNIVIAIIVVLTLVLTIMSYKNAKVGAKLETSVFVMAAIEVIVGNITRLSISNTVDIVILAINVAFLVYILVTWLKNRKNNSVQ